MRKKVLIIEDHQHIGTALKLLIQFEGYEAVVADLASKGRQLAATIQPDLIIVDVILPDGDGIELARDLRNAPETRDTPIVCVSSYIKDRKKSALAAGCNEVFSKTTFMECYAETLKKYLGEPEVRPESDSRDSLRSGGELATFDERRSNETKEVLRNNVIFGHIKV